jgi:hypothetical protein
VFKSCYSQVCIKPKWKIKLGLLQGLRKIQTLPVERH